MKTRMKSHGQAGRGSQRGSAVIVVIALLAILLIYAVGNVRTLDHLGRELRLMDQVQRRAWDQVQVRRSAEAVVPALPASGVETNRHENVP